MSSWPYICPSLPPYDSQPLPASSSVLVGSCDSPARDNQSVTVMEACAISNHVRCPASPLRMHHVSEENLYPSKVSFMSAALQKQLCPLQASKGSLTDTN